MPYSVFPRFGRIGLDYESRIRPVIKSSSLSLSLRKRPSRLLCHKGHCSRCEEVNQRANQTKEHSQSRLRCLWSFAGSPPGAPDSSLSSSFLSPPNNMPVGGSAYSKRVLAYVRYLAMDRCPIEVLFSHHAQYSRDTGFVNFCHSLSEEALVIVVFMCVNVLVVLQMYHLFPTWTFSVLKSLPPPAPRERSNWDFWLVHGTSHSAMFDWIVPWQCRGLCFLARLDVGVLDGWVPAVPAGPRCLFRWMAYSHMGCVRNAQRSGEAKLYDW